jgi:enoyl-CoA hydratase
MVADLGSLQRLPRIIGDAATRELAFTAKDIDADRALRLGLVSTVLDTREALMDAAHKEAETIAGHSPLVIQGVKHIMNNQEGWTVDQGLEYVATWNSAFLQSEDLTEALTAFMEKRKPEYKGV